MKYIVIKNFLEPEFCKKLAEEAFIDLKALMSKAREVVGRGSDRDGRDTVHCVISITALE